ncbi:hypothetical protein FPQ18DRAFT_326751 [Pyronema domesticum]|uniref:Uncharacterized protein n=1 Tax=Pyronema omphalodes (strain CBS 100304) TaxID=1076935 RepID=U4LCK0_PYROM|nr:hypothetical protein FPQ18DRAFT_326751 [Pyronema domesticum]CCX16631.1 Protein of unknown function [Pyronema omphalodes CBS 100304]
MLPSSSPNGDKNMIIMPKVNDPVSFYFGDAVPAVPGSGPGTVYFHGIPSASDPNSPHDPTILQPRNGSTSASTHPNDDGNNNITMPKDDDPVPCHLRSAGTTVPGAAPGTVYWHGIPSASDPNLPYDPMTLQPRNGSAQASTAATAATAPGSPASTASSTPWSWRSSSPITDTNPTGSGWSSPATWLSPSPSEPSLSPRERNLAPSGPSFTLKSEIENLSLLDTNTPNPNELHQRLSEL